MNPHNKKLDLKENPQKQYQICKETYKWSIWTKKHINEGKFGRLPPFHPTFIIFTHFFFLISTLAPLWKYQYTLTFTFDQNWHPSVPLASPEMGLTIVFSLFSIPYKISLSLSLHFTTLTFFFFTSSSFIFSGQPFIAMECNRLQETATGCNIMPKSVKR